MNKGDRGITKAGYPFVCIAVHENTTPMKHATLHVKLPTNLHPNHVNITVDKEGRYLHNAFETDYDVAMITRSEHVTA